MERTHASKPKPKRQLDRAERDEMRRREEMMESEIVGNLEQIDTTVAHVSGAIWALMAGKVEEFRRDQSDIFTGDTGIVEVRIEKGKILGVCVARLDTANPEIARGVRRVWDLTPEQIAAVSARVKLMMSRLKAKASVKASIQEFRRRKLLCAPCASDAPQ